MEKVREKLSNHSLTSVEGGTWNYTQRHSSDYERDRSVSGRENDLACLRIYNIPQLLETFSATKDRSQCWHISFSTDEWTTQSYSFSEMEKVQEESNRHLIKMWIFFWKGAPSSVCRAPFVLVLPSIKRNKSENVHLKMMMLLRRSFRQIFSSSLYGKRLHHMEMYHQTTTSNASFLLSSS